MAPMIRLTSVFTRKLTRVAYAALCSTLLSLPVALIMTSLTATVGAAQSIDAGTCRDLFQSELEELQAIRNDLRAETLDREMLLRLFNWKNDLELHVKDPEISDFVGETAVGAGSSALATLMLGGPPGWAAATLGAAISSVTSDSWTRIDNAVAVWTRVDEDTAFYQFILDYAEYGRVGDVSDPHLQSFLSAHADLIAQVTGRPLPTSPGQQSLYLQAYSSQLLLFVGMLEEASDGDAFPRMRWPETQGRYGFNRLAIGYYREVIAAKLDTELSRISRELELLNETRCDGSFGRTGQRPYYEACQRPPATGQTITCSCDIIVPGVFFGTDLYYGARGSVCSAAVHSGAIGPAVAENGRISYRGIVEVTGTLGCPFYVSTSRNGFRSDAQSQRGRSFFFPMTQRGYCDQRYRPPEGQWYCPSHFSDLEGSDACYCAPIATESGEIFGTDLYTADSTICRAARHAGVVNHRGGSVTIIEAAVRDEFSSSRQNDISSLQWSRMTRTFGFR